MEVCLLSASAGLSRDCPAHMDTARRPGQEGPRGKQPEPGQPGAPGGHSDNESRDRRDGKPHLLPNDQRMTFHEIVKIKT